MNKSTKTTPVTITHYRRTDDARLVLVPRAQSRSNRVASWIVWHMPELGCVLAPAVVALLVSPWLWLVAVAVAAGWTVRDVRLARVYAAIKAGRDLPPAVVSDGSLLADSDVDTRVDTRVDTGTAEVGDEMTGTGSDGATTVGASSDASGGVWL